MDDAAIKNWYYDNCIANQCPYFVGCIVYQIIACHILRTTDIQYVRIHIIIIIFLNIIFMTD